jgi:PIN domain nuclease of toxin-antitoxin system
MKVFDASAVLALVFAEAGADKAARLIEDGDAVISSVNHGEVVARLLERGLSEAEVNAVCEGVRLPVLPFTESQAVLSGRLRPATRSLGLSLGDRCCLALALENPAAQVVTADRPWKALKQVRVTLIR